MIKNLTPHDVTVILEGGSSMFFPKCENPARVETTVESLSTGDVAYNLPLFKTVFGDIVNLPDYESGVWNIVSRIVLEASNRNIGRQDLLVPHDVVRDDSGAIIGCKGFSVN